jgi:methylenetetrahydrofolate dehydrogenase (NADP+) / methenyltetrahydrofolate cyclohydrolase
MRVGMNLIDGKTIAAALRSEVALRAKSFQDRNGRPPGLHVVLVGDDQASHVYVRGKEKAAAEAGLAGLVHRLPADTSEAALLSKVRNLNLDESVDGILVQLPLPKHIDERAVLQAIDPRKDVDGFHPLNVGALWSGTDGLVPCTPRGCVHLLKQSGLSLSGKRAIVIGRSNIVGKPVSALLLRENMTVTIAHSRTLDLAARCREADVIVAAVGQAKMVQSDWVAEGATVIDVGMNRDEHGKLCGDVDFESVKSKVRAITPVPGGVGPLTIAMLLDNTVTAAERRVAK